MSMISSSIYHPPVAAILVGGLGTRLRPLIADVPKSLATVAGEPFLFLILRTLASYGIKKVVLLTGYMHDKVVSACGDGAAFNLNIIYSREHEPLGTAGALSHAAKYLQPYSDFILLNGDTHINAPLNDFIYHTLPPHFYGSIGVLPNEEFARYGSVQISSKGTIEAFREKDAQSTGLISAGIYKLSSAIFNLLPSDVSSTTPCSLERDIFPKIISVSHHEGLQAYLLNGSLHDIGTPESYTTFNRERMSP